MRGAAIIEAPFFPAFRAAFEPTDLGGISIQEVGSLCDDWVIAMPRLWIFFFFFFGGEKGGNFV